jgi:hypothetical protein
MTATGRRAASALALDIAAVLVFVTIGRRSHDEGGTISGIVETAAPFLIGLGVGWLVVRAWRWPMAIATGVAIWPVTVLVGMVCRSVLFDDGTAASFVIVATLFLGACFVGWRAVGRALAQRRQNSTATAGTS